MIKCAYCSVRNGDTEPFCTACGAPFVGEPLRKIEHVGNDQVFVDYISNSHIANSVSVSDVERDYRQRLMELQRDFVERQRDLQRDHQRQLYELYSARS